MKLPNFLVFDELVRLKIAMGIPPDSLGNFRSVEVRRVGATREEIRQLAEEGLELEKEDLVVLPDGTLSYKDRRVLLYIRDVSRYGNSYSDPRFHFCNCPTLQQMRENRRFGRYVIASRDDGLFKLHFVESRRSEEVRLDVCMQCLNHLNYDGFKLGKRSDVRRAAVEEFSISEFFTKFPKTLHYAMPGHTDNTAPANTYSLDFSLISRAYRQKVNWVCETCGISLSKDHMQRYLHVHHINGLKNENGEANLRAVCVHCHALEPAHGHVKATRQYREFEGTWQRWNKTGLPP